MAQKVLVVDVGGTHLKILASRQQTPMVKKLIFASEEGEFTRPKAHAAPRSSIRQGEQQPVLLALVIALLVVMCQVLLQGSAQRSLPEQDELRQAFLFHRSHPAFRIGV